MNKKIKALLDARANAIKACRDYLSAIPDGQDMTPEQQADYNALKAKIDSINTQIDREKELQAIEDAAGQPAAGDVIVVPGAQRITGGAPRSDLDPRGGFRHAGEFFAAVFSAGRPNGTRDERLRIGAAPTTYGNEAAGADGGFLVPVEFSNRIREVSNGQESLLPLTDNVPVSGNGMTFPADETTPHGTNGIRAYWEGEGQQATQTKPVIGERSLKLRKLFALVPVTDELSADTVALGAYLTKKTGESIRFKTNNSFFVGTGAGQPLGIANAAALVTQAKESGQAADTIVAGNIAKMYARNLNPTRAHWHIHPDAFNQLITMTIGNQPIWTRPDSGMKDAPGGLLLGRPVLFDESCQTLGDLGDIYFVDWKGYQTLTKQGQDIETAESMHLWFDYGINAFRAIFRVDGMPWLSAAVSPKNGSSTRSHFVTLAART